MATRKMTIQVAEAIAEALRIGLKRDEFLCRAHFDRKRMGYGVAVLVSRTLKAHGDEEWINRVTSGLRGVGATVTLYRATDGRLHFLGAKFDGRGNLNELGSGR